MSSCSAAPKQIFPNNKLETSSVTNLSENNFSLLGIDSNKDGIRDDVAEYILMTWGDKNTQNALLQYAKALSLTYDKKSYNEASSGIQAATLCLVAIRKISKTTSLNSSEKMLQAFADISVVRKKTLNTMPRVKAYFSYDDSLSGNTFSIPPEHVDYCEFKLEEK